MNPSASNTLRKPRPYPEIDAHRLRLFLHVVRDGGLAAALPHLPRAMQFNALSAQMLKLEAELGLGLFQRQPFRLTAAGRELVSHFPHLLLDLDMAEARLAALRQEGVALRIGFDPVLPPDILHPLLGGGEPSRQVQLASRSAADWAAELQAGSVDLVLTLREKDPPAGCAHRDLGDLTLGLAVTCSRHLRKASQLWDRPEKLPPLVAPPPDHLMGRAWQEGLRLGILRWPTWVSTTSRAEILALVAQTRAVGLVLCEPPPSALHHPSSSPDAWRQDEPAVGQAKEGALGSRSSVPGVKILPLSGFPSLRLAALWRPADTFRLQELLERLRVPGS